MPVEMACTYLGRNILYYCDIGIVLLCLSHHEFSFILASLYCQDNLICTDLGFHLINGGSHQIKERSDQ